jgi:hypothetical protein
MWLSVLVVLIVGCLVTWGALRAVRRTGTVRDRLPPIQTPTSLRIPAGEPAARVLQVGEIHDILL